MAGISHRICPECGNIITRARNGRYLCSRPFCCWEGQKTPVYYMEYPDANSGENRQPVYQGEK